MNSSVIQIEGIHADSQVIYLEHSTDTSHLLIIKDELGNKINVTIVNGKIIEAKLNKLEAAK